MTNFAYLQSMSVDELAEWLDKHGLFDDSPWNNWFNDTYCSKCDPITCKIKSTSIGVTPLYPEQEIDCSYCELEKKCKFFKHMKDIPTNTDIIAMWLKQEAKNEKN